MVSLLAQFPLAEQDMVVTEHMIQGYGHAEDTFCHNVCFAPAICGYMARFADFSGFEPEEAADTGVHHHYGMNNMV